MVCNDGQLTREALISTLGACPLLACPQRLAARLVDEGSMLRNFEWPTLWLRPSGTSPPAPVRHGSRGRVVAPSDRTRCRTSVPACDCRTVHPRLSSRLPPLAKER